MNPDELREYADEFDGLGHRRYIRAAADAWEADIAQRDSAQRQAKTFREALLEQNGVVLQLSKRLEAAEKAMTDALGRVTVISMAVDSVMAGWANEKRAELVPTTIGQWAEQAAEYLRAALAKEET